MKKITLKKDEKVSEFIVFDNIEAKNNIVTTRCIDGSSMAFSLLEDRQIIIEEYKEERDWLLVCGRFSEEIYAQSEKTFDDATQVKLQDFLTQSEAEELAEKIEKVMNSYKF